ncbi:hypothetical protein LZ30DRAFT_724679 [Colletotrichum cereale]|nr:hypothetical protein LZ30DRAFT_724679 [Colletotrichum cereale]
MNFKLGDTLHTDTGNGGGEAGTERPPSLCGLQGRVLWADRHACCPAAKSQVPGPPGISDIPPGDNTRSYAASCQSAAASCQSQPALENPPRDATSPRCLFKIPKRAWQGLQPPGSLGTPSPPCATSNYRTQRDQRAPPVQSSSTRYYSPD